MTPLFRKLNLGKQAAITVLDAPASFEPELAALDGVDVRRSIEGGAGFVLAFAITQAELDAACHRILAGLGEDAILWIAYPKGTSKRYRCEFNRDTGWSVLGAAGYEPVRQVAIDDDWSALRFRKAEAIRSFRRDPAHAISPAGQARSARRTSA